MNTGAPLSPRLTDHLNPVMWDRETLLSAWDKPPVSVSDVKSSVNIVEWSKGFADRVEWLERLEERFEELETAGFKRAGVLTNGVGGLAIACHSLDGEKAVAKWWPGTRPAIPACAAAVALSDADLGPKVLHVGDSLLVSECVQGVPLRFYVTTWVTVEEALQSLLPVTAVLNSAIKDKDLLRVNELVFFETAITKWVESNEKVVCVNGLDALHLRPEASHGDAQLGNVLRDGTKLKWIDAGPAEGGVIADAARLLRHAWVDAYTTGTHWDPTNGVEHASSLLDVDATELALFVRWYAMHTVVHVSERAPDRVWEIEGSRVLAHRLS